MAMLLNPTDYKYEYYHQKRGQDGMAGSIYLATPYKSDSVRLLVKSAGINSSINEYIGCNLGGRLGVNTPKAWLFKPDDELYYEGIDFTCAVGIEFLDGLEDRYDSLYWNDEIAAQSIRAIVLHKLMYNTDNSGYEIYNGKVYAFDFGEGFFPYFYNIPSYINKCRATILRPGDPNYDLDLTLTHEHNARQGMLKYVFGIEESSISEDLPGRVYSEMREKMITEYNKNQFSDLVAEIEEAYSSEAAGVVRDRLGAMQQAMISF